MSLEDTTKIDLVLKAPTDRGLYLIVVDGGEISDELRRYHLVFEKLMTYVEYVASGQYRKQSSDVARENITACVVCATPPNDAMKQIVSMISRQQPQVRLPVIVETQQEFFARTKIA